MRILFCVLFIVSCAGQKPVQIGVDASNLKTYKQEFASINQKLSAKAKTCRSYSETNLELPLKEVPINEVNPFGAMFKNPKQVPLILASYRPEEFDWDLLAKLKYLYLSFPFESSISEEHFKAINSVNDCLNEFSHLNFLKANLTLLNDENTKPDIKSKSQNVLRIYFKYLKNNEIPLVSVLTTSHIIDEMAKYKILTIKDENLHKKKFNELHTLYTQSGKEIIDAFRERNYKRIYFIDQKLKIAAGNYKEYLLEEVASF